MRIINDNEVQRIPTKIHGLDKLLNGGLDIINRPFSIVIRGGVGTESTLFGLQLLYGIALSLNEEEREIPFKKPVEPYFATSCHKKEDIETLMIDTYISSCVYSMTRRIIEQSYQQSDLSMFTNSFFDTSHIVCSNNPTAKTPELPIKAIRAVPDQLIAESVMYYNNRTRALHYRTADSIADLSNMVYKRSCNSIHEYIEKDSSISQRLYKSLHTQLIDTKILTVEEMRELKDVSLLAIEIDNTKGYSLDEMRKMMALINKDCRNLNSNSG